MKPAPLPVIIASATPEDCARLTEIAFAAKRVWDYPEEYFAAWKGELTITPDYAGKNAVFTAICEKNVVGWCSIASVDADFYSGNTLVTRGLWLDHLFVAPEAMHRGIGSKLFGHAAGVCRAMGSDALSLFSDPNARGFYVKMGARYICEVPSSIEGRTVSLFELEL